MKRLLIALGLIVAWTAPAPAAAAPALPGPGAAMPARPPVITVDAPAGKQVDQAALAVAVRIHHYNMCNGWSTRDDDACNEAQATNAENLLLFLSRADGAWFMSVNEICQDTFGRLASALGVAGTMVISKQREGDCRNTGFGNAIFHPGGVRQDGTAWFFPTQADDRDCTVATVECRTGLCLKLATFAGPMAQCTAHLGAGSTGRTTIQSAEYAFIARSWVEPGRRLSLAGDFNLTPDELHPVYDGLIDIVLGDTHDTRGELDEHIDYIFVERVGLRIPHTAFCPDNASDHCYTAGEWHL